MGQKENKNLKKIVWIVPPFLKDFDDLRRLDKKQDLYNCISIHFQISERSL